MTAAGGAGDDPLDGALDDLTDEDSAGYWAGLREHRLLLQRCTTCTRLRFPPMPRCPYCASPTSVVEERPGPGSVYSFVRVHRALSPQMEGQTPYVIATITLDDGPRLLARIDGDDGSLAIDDHVQPCFIDHADWTELRYTR